MILGSDALSMDSSMQDKLEIQVLASCIRNPWFPPKREGTSKGLPIFPSTSLRMCKKETSIHTYLKNEVSLEALKRNALKKVQNSSTTPRVRTGGLLGVNEAS